ncbi:hypothetical protein HY416_03565 [Candidatus Kaiserbacteria bacterium]|nr:hypothetical protein [Candidatus Kaiserbacteria bacterium]
MSKLQKTWLYAILVFALLHYLRDTLQDLEMYNVLSSFLVKDGHAMVFIENQFSAFKIYWAIFNTYAFAVAEIMLSAHCLYRKRFGRAGYATIIIAVIWFCVWLFSWLYFN